jgi:phosphatidylserine/phosphatidylglycerophosphate/cardiolipin synthase-like enzyme
MGIFDGAEAIVGSYNLDPRSERLNSETALALRGDTLAGDSPSRYSIA